LCGTKNIIFQKRTGGVVENKGKGYIDSRKRTGNKPKSEAERLLKTRSCGKNEPETKLPVLLKIQDGEKKLTGEITGLDVATPAPVPPTALG
jgi:hypothetical protein